MEYRYWVYEGSFIVTGPENEQGYLPVINEYIDIDGDKIIGIGHSKYEMTEITDNKLIKILYGGE